MSKYLYLFIDRLFVCIAVFVPECKCNKIHHITLTISRPERGKGGGGGRRWGGLNLNLSKRPENLVNLSGNLQPIFDRP